MLQVNSFTDLLQQAASRFGSETFLIEDEVLGTVRYADVLHFARGLEAQFDEMGIPVGAPVATVFHNCGLAALLFLATIASRRVFVPLNPLSTNQELEYMLDRAQCDAVIVDPSHPRATNYARRRTILVQDQRGYFRERHAQGIRATVHEENAAPSEVPAEVVFTSGSTGRPKGILLSQLSLLSDAQALAEVYRLRSSDRFLTVCPLFHNSGQVLTTLACALVGGSTAAIKSDVGMLNFWSFVDRYRADWSLGMVSFLALLLARPGGPAKPGAMRGLLTGGSAIDAGLVRKFEARFGFPVRTVYGLTESASISTCEFDDPEPRSLGSSGRPLPICDVRIGADPAHLASFGEPAAKSPGEIWIAGPNLFEGYVGDPALTRTRKKGPWLQTGDLGYFDAHGNLFVVDRLDSMLIVGGENVYPAEVERLCAQLPGAAQIVLTGVPHPIWGTELVLVYQSEAGATVSTGAWHRMLADEVAVYKLPQRYVSVADLGLADFPRKENGKLDRQAVARLVAALSRTSRVAAHGNARRDHQPNQIAPAVRK